MQLQRSQRLITLFAALVLSVFTLSKANADTLQQSSVNAYIATLEDVKVFTDQLRQAGEQDAIIQNIRPALGESFDPHQRMARVLQQKYPAELTKLNAIVAKQGFTSASSWARVGDRVVVVYGALKANQIDPQVMQLAQQPVEQQMMMLQMVPAQHRANVSSALALAHAIGTVTAQERELVAPHVAQLDKIFKQ